MGEVEGKVADGRVLALLRGYLTQEVLAGATRWRPERGTPQGAVISPLLANIYLDPLDHWMAAAGYEMVRYADDFVILCGSRGEAEAALQAVEAWVAGADLTLHPEKTRIVEATRPGGFDFLGYHFERGRRWPSRRSLGRFQEAIRVRTKRTSGSPASGSPVGGVTSERVDRPRHRPPSGNTTHVPQRSHWASDDGRRLAPGLATPAAAAAGSAAASAAKRPDVERCRADCA